MDSKRGVLTLFDRAKSKLRGSSAIDSVLTPAVTTTDEQKPQEQSAEIPAFDSVGPTFKSVGPVFESLEEMKRYEAVGKFEYYDIPKRAPLKKLDILQPELFLRQLDGLSTKEVAELMRLNKCKLNGLKLQLKRRPNDLLLHACHALLTNNIMELQLDKIQEAASYLHAQKFDPKTIISLNVISYVRNAKSFEEFASVLKTRETENGYLNLAGMDFSRVNFAGVNLSYANLCNTNFSEANISQANFRGANLQHVKMINTNTAQTNFCKANFCRGTLTPFADRKLEQESDGNSQLKHPRFNGSTFISIRKKLNTDLLSQKLDSLLILNIPMITILENVMLNLANAKLKYTLQEKMDLLTIMFEHDFLSENVKSMNQSFMMFENIDPRKYCRRWIQKELESLVLAIASNQFKESP